VELPKGVELEQTGDIKQFKASAKRMVGAIIIAVVLILLTLIVMFGNIKIALMILLSGVIVNNAILLIHFAIEEIEKGAKKREAMLEAIKIRTRPVLMTAFAVSAGMLPVSQGSAIGLERLAPLGAVAIGGLVVGTFMTLVFIPIWFIWFVKEENLVES